FAGGIGHLNDLCGGGALTLLDQAHSEKRHRPGGRDFEIDAETPLIVIVSGVNGVICHYLVGRIRRVAGEGTTGEELVHDRFEGALHDATQDRVVRLEDERHAESKCGAPQENEEPTNVYRA